MWTLAASFSVHYQNTRESLYRHTRGALDRLDSTSTQASSGSTTEVELVQSWLFLAIHELMCVDFRRGWMSAGRAFRLIQLSWLQDPDSTNLNLGQTEWVEMECRRRAFWLAYCLDRFISIRNGSPVTFSEQVNKNKPPYYLS